MIYFFNIGVEKNAADAPATPVNEKIPIFNWFMSKFLKRYMEILFQKEANIAITINPRKLYLLILRSKIKSENAPLIRAA